MTNQPHQQKAIKIILLLIIAVDAAGISLVYPSLTPLFLDTTSSLFSTTLDITDRNLRLGITFAAYPFFMFIGSLVIGHYSDRYGRRLALLICVLGLAAGHFITAIGIISDQFFLILTGRCLAGLTAGCHVVAQATIADISDSQQKICNMNQLTLANSMGFAIGPIIGGLLVQPGGNEQYMAQLPFLMTAMIAVMLAIFVYTHFPETRQQEHTTKSHASWLTTLIRLIKQPILYGLTAIFFLMVTGWNFYYQFLSVYLNNQYDFTGFEIGLFMGYLAALLMLFICFLAKRLMHYWGVWYNLIIGLALMSLSFGINIVVNDFVILALSIIPQTLGLAVVQLAVLTLFTDYAQANERGTVLGLASAAKSIAWIIAPLISGIIVNWHSSLPFIAAFLCTMLAIGVALKTKLDYTGQHAYPKPQDP